MFDEPQVIPCFLKEAQTLSEVCSANHRTDELGIYGIITQAEQQQQHTIRQVNAELV